MNELTGRRRRPTVKRIALALCANHRVCRVAVVRLMRTGTRATVGNSAPDFELPMLDGGSVASDGLKGYAL